MPTRLIAATLCLALTLGMGSDPFPRVSPPQGLTVAALRVGQENAGLEELKTALPSPASAGLEERPMIPPPVLPSETASAGPRLVAGKAGGGMTAAEAVEHATRAMPDVPQLDASLLAIRPLRPGQSSLHLGSGSSGLPAAEGFLGLTVDLMDLTATGGTWTIKALYDRYRARTGVGGGPLTASYGDVRQWLPQQTKRWDHITLIDLFTGTLDLDPKDDDPRPWTAQEVEAFTREIVRHSAPDGTILISGLGRETRPGSRMRTVANAASWLNIELKRQGIPFTKDNASDWLPPGAADTELQLFTLAPLQEQIRAMLARVTADRETAAPLVRSGVPYQIVSQELAVQHRGLAVLAELGHHVLVDHGPATITQLPWDVQVVDYYGSETRSERFGMAASAAGRSLGIVRHPPEAESLARLLRQLFATLGNLAPDLVAQRVDVDLLARWLEQAA